MSLVLTSTAFDPQEAIPARYTCDGEDISPPLAWSGEPQDAASLVLIMEDPDAPRGVFTHWVLFDLPLDVHALPEAVPAAERVVGRAVQGRNDFGTLGYRGPCPPAAPPHRYRFRLYAVGTALSLDPGSSKEEVLTAMQG